jgi:hypothetical protein
MTLHNLKLYNFFFSWLLAKMLNYPYLILITQKVVPYKYLALSFIYVIHYTKICSMLAFDKVNKAAYLVFAAELALEIVFLTA